MTIKAISAPIHSRTAQTLLGPCILSVYYAGDCYEVVTECEDDEGREIRSSDFFSSLSSARAYVDEY